MAIGEWFSNLGQGIKEFAVGKPGKVKQLPLLSPQQQQLQSQIINQVLSMLQQPSGIKEFNFAPIAEQARTKFATETVPSLAERFTAMGGGQRSSAFQGALGSAAGGLEQALAALQAQVEPQYSLQRQSLHQNLLSNLLGLGLKTPFENIYQQGTQGALPGISQGLISALPYLLALA